MTQSELHLCECAIDACIRFREQNGGRMVDVAVRVEAPCELATQAAKMCDGVPCSGGIVNGFLDLF